MQTKIIYEQPLNERVRSFLRLEHLFQLIDFRLDQTSAWDYRVLLESMLEIVDLLSLSDLKAELIKELAKHSPMLLSLKNNPAVDQQRLLAMNERIAEILLEMRDSQFQPGTNLKNDEMVSSYKQRISIPGGTCNFDLPRFHHWLNLPTHKKIQKINHWLADIDPIKQATLLSLDMLRNSSNPSLELAENGFFQRPIKSNLSCQLIRVMLSEISSCYPEISGGKHRFTIRFMSSEETDQRPVQTESNIEFKLHCCIL